jgi:hypothetical protein
VRARTDFKTAELPRVAGGRALQRAEFGSPREIIPERVTAKGGTAMRKRFILLFFLLCGQALVWRLQRFSTRLGYHRLERIWNARFLWLVSYRKQTEKKFGGGGSRTPVRKAQRPEAYMLSPFRLVRRRRSERARNAAS